MKTTFSLFFLWCFVFISGQYVSPKIKLVKDWKSSKTFKGNIAGKPITLHLEYLNHSGWHDKVFSVKGWYYYNAFKKKIPLMGFYNGNLLLYNFDDRHKFMYKNIERMDEFCFTYPCPKFTVYDEFIEINQNETKIQNGFMKKKGKTYNLKIFSDDLDITARNEWLYLPNGKTYDLYNVLDAYGGNSIISTYEDKDENRILFSFERDSNFNKQGYCGATEPETGYRLLTFDKKWKVKSLQVFSINSCLTNISLTKVVKTKYDFIKAYYVSVDEMPYLLIVNLKNATIASRPPMHTGSDQK